MPAKINLIYGNFKLIELVIYLFFIRNTILLVTKFLPVPPFGENVIGLVTGPIAEFH